MMMLSIERPGDAVELSDLLGAGGTISCYMYLHIMPQGLNMSFASQPPPFGLLVSVSRFHFAVPRLPNPSVRAWASFLVVTSRHHASCLGPSRRPVFSVQHHVQTPSALCSLEMLDSDYLALRLCPSDCPCLYSTFFWGGKCPAIRKVYQSPIRRTHEKPKSLRGLVTQILASAVLVRDLLQAP